MTSEATLYEDARIDAATISAHYGAADDLFWHQAYTSAIRRTRSISILAASWEPNLCEVAALLDNDTVLEALAEVGSARTRNTEDDQRNRTNQGWLTNDWRAMDHRLRNSIVEGIRQAANSSLTVTDTTGEAGASTIGKRQGPWFHDGHLRWNISRLPARTRTAIEQVVSELHPETRPNPGRGRIQSARPSVH